MPQVAYPTDAQIQAFLTSIGYTLPAGFTVSGYAAEASAEWERRTGFVPFLGQTQTRMYDPAGPNKRLILGYRLRGGSFNLDLNAGLYRVDSLTIGVGVGDAGTLLTANQDFFMLPAMAPQENSPWTSIRFLIPQFGTDLSIQLTGGYGYGAQIPDDAYKAVLRMGAIKVIDETFAVTLAGGSSLKQADFAITYGKSPSEDLQEKVDSAVARYTLASFV